MVFTRLIDSKCTRFMFCSSTRNIYLTSHRACDKYLEKTMKREEFTPIYKFPYIRVLGVLNKLKLYQMGVTSVSIPGSILLNQISVLPTESVLVTCAVGITGCMVLFSLGYITQKFVGFIYLNKTEDKVKVSYIDFWGNRKDEIIDMADIVPLSDLPFSLTDGLFFKLCRFSTMNYLKLNIRFGYILDSDKFSKVFK